MTLDRQGKRHYQLIDADTHVNEPPDLWIDRVPSKFKDRAPRMQRFEAGDAWILEGVKDPINFGLNAAAGMPLADMRQWMFWEEVRPGGYDPKARLAEMDADQVDAQVFYPTPRLSHSLFANTDTEFHLALIRAYNDWLAEFCSEDTSRLGGIMLLPNRGVEGAVAEFERMMTHPGIKGALIGCWPHGDLELTTEDDAIFALASEANVPLHIHVGLVNEMPGAHKAKLPGDVRLYDAPTRLLQLLWGGVFERFPDLVTAFVETDIGWVPYLKEQLDDRWYRLRLYEQMDMPQPPSFYFERNIYFTFITDAYGIRNRHDIGVERIMWSSDYPHLPGNWPTSWRTLNASFSGVPPEERHLIVAGNAQRLYHFSQ